MLITANDVKIVPGSLLTEYTAKNNVYIQFFKTQEMNISLS